MSEKHKEHIFEWVAIYKDKNNTERILRQFDEDSEYYDRINGIVPFVPIVMNILNREKRLQSFHLVPRGKPLSIETLPRYTVDLKDGTFTVNGQLFNLLPINKQLSNYRLIYYFATAKVTGSKEDGSPDLNNIIDEYIRLYKLGLQANDDNGKNYQKIMIWNRENEGITIQERR